jgi:hypothetical protein
MSVLMTEEVTDVLYYHKDSFLKKKYEVKKGKGRLKVV